MSNVREQKVMAADGGSSAGVSVDQRGVDVRQMSGGQDGGGLEEGGGVGDGGGDDGALVGNLRQKNCPMRPLYRNWHVQGTL